MKKTFKLIVDTEITIDFSSWGLSDAQQKGCLETKRLVINHFLEQCRLDKLELSEKNSSSLFEAMPRVVKAQNDCALTLRALTVNTL